MTRGHPKGRRAALHPENVYVDRGGAAGVSGVPWGTIQRWDMLGLLPRCLIVRSLNAHDAQIVYRLSDILQLAERERRFLNGAGASRPAP